MDESKHPGGRPPKFETPELMQVVIDAYFAECDPHVAQYQYFKTSTSKGGRTTRRLVSERQITKQVAYTMSGLADALVLSRRALLEYKKKDAFLPTLKAARRKVEVFVERLMLGSSGVVAGVIFNAKNNFGWVDKTEQDANVRTPTTLHGGSARLLADDAPDQDQVTPDEQ